MRLLDTKYYYEWEYTNILELYGLKTNPFFTEHLLLFGGLDRDLSDCVLGCVTW